MRRVRYDVKLQFNAVVSSYDFLEAEDFADIFSPYHNVFAPSRFAITTIANSFPAMM